MIIGDRYGVTFRGRCMHLNGTQCGGTEICPQCKLILKHTPTMYLLQTRTHTPPHTHKKKQNKTKQNKTKHRIKGHDFVGRFLTFTM